MSFKIRVGIVVAMILTALWATAEAAPPSTTPPVPVATAMTLPPSPSVEEIEALNDKAEEYTFDYLFTYQTPPLQYQGSTACSSEWETDEHFEEFAARVESKCFSIALYTDPQLQMSEPVVVVNYVEFLNTDETFIWGFDIMTYNESADAAAQIPTFMLDANGNQVPYEFID